MGALAGACGGGGSDKEVDNTFDNSGGTGGGTGGTPSNTGGAFGSGGSGAGLSPTEPGPTEPPAQNIESLRIEPEDALLVVPIGETGEQSYRIFAKLEGSSAEQEITDRSVFYVPDNHLIGGFSDNGPMFQTATDEPRGGPLTVRALAANATGEASAVETSLTVKYVGALPDPRDDGSGDYDVPADAAKLFEDAPEDGDRAPLIVYPNDGVLMPPNLSRLDVHWRPGSEDNTLYEVAFVSPTIDLRYYLRCGEPINGGCAFELDPLGYRLIAEANRGLDPIAITVRGTDDDGSAAGSSGAVELGFAETDVHGGLYYWTTSDDTAIMRFDFGVVDAEPELFLSPDDNSSGTCVGCHALSRDGSKMVASLGGQRNGWQVLITDLSRPKSDADYFAKRGEEDDPDPIQFASWNPDGSRFVAVYGDTNDLDIRHRLWFHDGATGERLPDESLLLDFEPDHPDWSPDGQLIAFTRVGKHQTSQRPKNGGLELIRWDGSAWSAPETLVPVEPGLSRYNPSFLPGSELLVFSESTCPDGDIDSSRCDGDDDPTATTWALPPTAGATPVHLTRASTGGLEDGDDITLHDTFPRSSPFVGKYQGRDIYWVTISSRRLPGLRAGDRQLLWMFAVDPAAILEGNDGSYPAFYLPFQDLSTSNHIGQWTQRVVTDDPPPEPEPPPTPGVPVPPPVE